MFALKLEKLPLREYIVFMENMRHLPGVEQRKAVIGLQTEAAKVIDFENSYHQTADGQVTYDATWYDGDYHYELAAETRVNPKRVSEKFSSPYADTTYYMSVWSTTSDEAEYYLFGSRDDFITACDEEWDEMDVDSAESQIELAQRLIESLKTYNRLSDEQAFKDVVMNYALSGSLLSRREMKKLKHKEPGRKITERFTDKYPILDETTVTNGIKRMIASRKTNGPDSREK